MSTRTFCSKEEYSDNDWSAPKVLSDSSDFQVEYTSAEVISNIDKFTGNEEEWRNSQKKYGID